MRSRHGRTRAGTILATIAVATPNDSTGRQEIWNSSAPASVIEARLAGDSQAEWSNWRQHLAERKQPLPLQKVSGTNTSPLSWCLPEEVHVGEHLAIVRRLRQADAKHRGAGGFAGYFDCWLRDAPAGDFSLQRAFESLAWCYALPELARRMDPRAWWELYECLAETAKGAAARSLDDAPLVHQWLAAELPLTLSYVLPELAASAPMRDDSREAFSRGILELLDGEGLIQAKHWNQFFPLLACWTRARGISQHVAGSVWSDEAEEQYQWSIRQAFRVMRRDRSQILSHGRAGTYSPAMFRVAARFLKEKDDQKLASRLKSDQARRKRQAPGWYSLEPSVHSEWAEVAVLRPDWSETTPRLAVTYSGRPVQMELSVGRDMLWRGAWDFEVQINGAVASLETPWEEICWVADGDVLYVELEASLTWSCKIQRQILLARKDSFVLLADAILGKEAAELRYRATVPLLPDIGYVPAEESREGFLEGSKYRGLVLPLGLPEWRSDRRFGEVRAAEQRLELSQHTIGKNLFAPLWIDLDRKRMLKPCTWRQLTVAQTRKIEPYDAAVAYRVQAGKKQWLVYRSLTKPANRTVLGHNLSTEFLVGRFDRQGTVEALIEIE